MVPSTWPERSVFVHIAERDYPPRDSKSFSSSLNARFYVRRSFRVSAFGQAGSIDQILRWQSTPSRETEHFDVDLRPSDSRTEPSHSLPSLHERKRCHKMAFVLRRRRSYVFHHMPFGLRGKGSAREADPPKRNWICASALPSSRFHPGSTPTSSTMFLRRVLLSEKPKKWRRTRRPPPKQPLPEAQSCSKVSCILLCSLDGGSRASRRFWAHPRCTGCASGRSTETSG